MHHRVSRIWPKCNGQDGSSVICTSCGALVACSRAEAQWLSIHIDPQCWYSTDFNTFQHGTSMVDILGLLPVWWIAKTLFGENDTKKIVLELRWFFFPTPEAHRQMWCPNLEDGHQVREADQCTSWTNAFNTNMVICRAPSFERSCDRREPTMLMAAVLNLNRF